MLFFLGCAFIAALLLFAMIGPSIRWDPLEQAGVPHMAPSSKFWLGTDELGRDIFARLAFGAQISLKVGLTVQALSLLVGIAVGVIGVFGSRWIATPLMRLTDAMFAFPDILLAILIIGVWSRGLFPVIVALSITAWPAVARLVRGQVASLKDREYVAASAALGAGAPYLVTRHVLPHLWSIVLAVSMVELAGTILAESALSFLGIGVQAPDPSWGSMINSARASMNSYPMELVWPCLILSATVFALNFIGDGLRQILDPRSR